MKDDGEPLMVIGHRLARTKESGLEPEGTLGIGRRRERDWPTGWNLMRI